MFILSIYLSVCLFLHVVGCFLFIYFLLVFLGFEPRFVCLVWYFSLSFGLCGGSPSNLVLLHSYLFSFLTVHHLSISSHYSFLLSLLFFLYPPPLNPTSLSHLISLSSFPIHSFPIFFLFIPSSFLPQSLHFLLSFLLALPLLLYTVHKKNKHNDPDSHQFLPVLRNDNDSINITLTPCFLSV